MTDAGWADGLPAAVTVTDRDGRVIYMNGKSCATFAREGGAALVGRDVVDCHPAHAREKVAALLGSRRTNVYMIEKDGVRKLIYQCPWFRGGEYAGFVELSLPVPAEIPLRER